jgi:predicted transcriptional regulator
MSLKGRKYKIIEQLMQLNEDQVQRVETFLKEQEALDRTLEQAARDIQEGRVQPHEEVRKKYEKWL